MLKKVQTIKIFLAYLLRSFFGVLDFMEGGAVKMIIEGWFRLLEWSSISALLMLASVYSKSKFILYIAIISYLLALFYSMHFWTGEIWKAYYTDIENANHRNKKYNFPLYSKFSTAMTFMLIMVLVFATSICGVIIVSSIVVNKIQ